MQITRHEARVKLAAAMVARMNLNKRAAILSEWWMLDPGDEEWAELPIELRQELEITDEAPSDASPQRYDSLIQIAVMKETLGVQNSWLQEKLREVGETVEILGEPEPMVECRCCGSLSINERGAYEICPVCFWEDDGLRELDRVSGPNHMTLREGKKNFQRIGACSKDLLQYIEPDARSKYVQATPSLSGGPA